MAARLDATTQARLLDLIGVERYLLRGARPTTKVEADIATPSRAVPVVVETTRTRPTIATPPMPDLARDRASATRPSLLAELGGDARAPQLLLFVETPRVPDPRGPLLLAAIRRLLPPHQMLDAGDVPSSWLPQAIALGGRVAAPAGTQLHAAPALASLRQDTAAKRALWRIIRRLRRTPRTG